MNNQYQHISVLLDESIDALNIKPDGIYFDCTFGRGGHSKEILKHLNNQGRLYALDCDQTAIDYANATIDDNRFTIIHSNFENLEEILKSLKINRIDGFLFDLGVSSPQIDDPLRGFSFQHDGRLDMRMDQRLKVSAYELINEYSLEALTNVFYKYAESKFSHVVAKKIVNARKTSPIVTTFQLVDVIKSALPKKELFKDKHPAKVFFQALRIEVNKELTAINQAITIALKHLKLNGRLVVISFHSLENKTVKTAIKEVTNQFNAINYLPTNDLNQYKMIKTNQVSEKELNQNYRSHSAQLKVIERIKDE